MQEKFDKIIARRIALLKGLDSRYLIVYSPSNSDSLLTLEEINPKDVVLQKVHKKKSLSLPLYLPPSSLGSYRSEQMDGITFQQQINMIPPGSSKHRMLTQLREMREHAYFNPKLATIEEITSSWTDIPTLEGYENNAKRFEEEYAVLFSEGIGLFYRLRKACLNSSDS